MCWEHPFLHYKKDITKVQFQFSFNNEQFTIQKALYRTTNEGPVRIQYNCLVLIYVFPEMKLLGLVISKTEL